jgi:precorrin-2 methylase
MAGGAAPAETRRTRRGSLVVVGTGIKAIAQTTLETAASIRNADRVFYLVDEPVTSRWIRRLNPTAIALDTYYAEGKPRSETYEEIADLLVDTVRAGFAVCAVFYGHPGTVVDSSHDAIRRLRRAGYPARMLPGISTLDCLIADLNVDPGALGCQVFEAMDFLAARRRFDATSVLILWQVGALGEASVHDGLPCRPERLAVLTSRLLKSYPPRHRIALYEAPQFPACQPIVRWIRLEALPRTRVWPVMTLFIPPTRQRRDDPKIVRWFDES